jgi:hypothetical protein
VDGSGRPAHSTTHRGPKPATEATQPAAPKQPTPHQRPPPAHQSCSLKSDHVAFSQDQQCSDGTLVGWPLCDLGGVECHANPIPNPGAWIAARLVSGAQRACCRASFTCLPSTNTGLRIREFQMVHGFHGSSAGLSILSASGRRDFAARRIQCLSPAVALPCDQTCSGCIRVRIPGVSLLFIIGIISIRNDVWMLLWVRSPRAARAATSLRLGIFGAFAALAIVCVVFHYVSVARCVYVNFEGQIVVHWKSARLNPCTTSASFGVCTPPPHTSRSSGQKNPIRSQPTRFVFATKIR